MDEETGVLVKIPLDRSQEDIETAEELLELGREGAGVEPGERC